MANRLAAFPDVKKPEFTRVIIPRGESIILERASQPGVTGPRIRSNSIGIFVLMSTLSCGEILAQTVSTVREAEFRSRWTDYQVDQIKPRSNEEKPEATVSSFIAKYTQFGPLEFHGGLTSGYEYSNEQTGLVERQDTTDFSAFLAPSLIAIYEKELGTWNLSSRYSVGWLYYLDPNYSGSNGDVSTSQTANLSLLRDNQRLTVRSTTSASSGTGFDIERGQATDRVSVNETVSVEYQLSEYLRTGVSGTFSYDDYSTPDGGLGASDSTTYTYAVAAFVDNFWTEKTAYRLEISSGGNSQQNSNTISNDRSYAQGVLRVNYAATAKFAFTGSVGLGVREDPQETQSSQNGMRAVYSLSTTYTPSDKTSARLYVGIEGASSQPEFTLAVNWHPREFTFFEMSIYQQTGLSNFATTNERVSKGFLVSFRQRLFSRLESTLSGGYEKNASIINDSIANEEEPYYFTALAFGWQLNAYTSLQTQVRTSTRRSTFGRTEDGKQTRASMSLSLTF